MKFAYARTGGPLLSWSGASPPSPSRAAETRDLGAFSLVQSSLRRYLKRAAVAPVIEYGPIIDVRPSTVGCCGLGEYNVPMPGAPEMVAGYMPEGAARTISGYIPEGAARTYGSTTIGDASAPAQALMDVIEGPVNMVASLAMVYHGYKRNNGSILWALLWGFTGLFGVPFALAQGYGKPRLTSNPGTWPGRTPRKSWRKRLKRRIHARRARQGYFKTKNVKRRKLIRANRQARRRRR